MESLKDIIKMHRLSAGLSRRELAEYAGVSTTFLSDVEGGKETIRFDKILDVFNVLNIEIIFDSPTLRQIKQSEES